jgi:two-component system sensor histidine kinase KdpD
MRVWASIHSSRLVGYLAAVILTSAGTAVLVGLNQLGHVPTISLLYVPIILLVAVSFGTWPSLLAATLAVLEYDFFFLQPLFTFTINRVEDILALLIFVIVALSTSQLAARARERAEAAQRRAMESTTLYELGQALTSGHEVPLILQAITRRVVEVFGVDRCAIFVPGEDGKLVLAAETPEGAVHDRADRATASWVLQQGMQVARGGPAGMQGGGNPASVSAFGERTFVPLRTADRTVGVMEVGRKAVHERSGEGRGLDTDERRLVVSFTAQAALVIAQAQNEQARHRVEVLEESDRLKSALLNAVSHDLRTPLTSIKASASALLLGDGDATAWSTPEGRELLETINHEADRLNRLVGNLLDLSRIEAGVLRPILEWYDIAEVVAALRSRIEPLIVGRSLTAEVETGIPPVQLDLLRIEELVINVVENAGKYTPPGSPLGLRIEQRGDALMVAVIDHGPGVPASLRERIFDAFYQGRRHGDRWQPDTAWNGLEPASRPQAGSEPAGAGLGLAISRGIAQAHGGSLTVEETPGGGATFVLTLPHACSGHNVDQPESGVPAAGRREPV